MCARVRVTSPAPATRVTARALDMPAPGISARPTRAKGSPRHHPIHYTCGLRPPTPRGRIVKQTIVTLDMEGVLTPEIWIAVAEKTGIPELRRTTRDEPDYDVLMRGRLDILNTHGLGLSDIQTVIGTLAPLPGAKAFLDELRSITQVVILSDTFEQFAAPLMVQLGMPTLLCHRLVIEDDRVVDYRLRLPEQKREAVAAFKRLNYRVVAAGDSYNDTTMLKEADAGFLFHAPANVRAEFPQFPAVDEFDELLGLIRRALVG